MTDFPARGQQAPDYWDAQLKSYIDEGLATKPDAVALDQKLDTTALDAETAANVTDTASDTRAAINDATAGKLDASALDAETALRVADPGSETRTAMDTVFTADISGKLDTSALDPTTADNIDNPVSETRVALDAAVAGKLNASALDAQAASKVNDTNSQTRAAIDSAAAGNPAPSWAGNRKGHFNPALGLYRPNPLALEKARSKAAKALNGAGSLHISVLGDSQTSGFDPTTAWPFVLRRRLSDFYGVGGSGIRFPIIGYGSGWVWNNPTTGAFTNPVSMGIYPNSGGGSSVVGVPTDASIDITAGMDYDYVVLYYVATGVAPRIRRNGQTDAANNWLVPGYPGDAPTAANYTGLTAEAGYMKAANPAANGGQVVVKITPSNPQATDVFRIQSGVDAATTALFAGIEFRRNDAKGGVRVSNLAQSGRTMQELVDGYPKGNVDEGSGKSGMAMGLDMPRADLNIIALSGTNDWNNFKDVASFKVYLTTAVRRARATALQGTNGNSTPASSDVVLVVMPEMDYAWYANPANGQNNANSPTYRSYMTAVYEVADTEVAPVIDLAWRWQDHARAQTLGIKADQVHPSANGHMDYAEAVHGALTALLGGGPSNPTPQPPTFVGATAKRSTAQALTTTPVAIPLDVETRDTDNFHSTVTNTERFTVPDGKAGYYILTGTAMHAPAPIYMQFFVNNAAVGPVTRITVPSDFEAVPLTILRYLNDGDYVDFRVAVVTGTGSVLANSCEVSIARIGV